MSKRTLILSIVVVGIILDQGTKLLVHRTIPLYQSIPVIDGFFSLTHVRNRGAAFSILSQTPWRLPFFLAVTLVAMVTVGVMLRRVDSTRTLEITGLSLILSGALGNLIDRLRLGEVIDFLDIFWRGHHWPAFNVADSAICIGVGILIYDTLRRERAKKEGG
ncbi:MAG: signal peptidase II [Desulfuromonadia bacterium]